TWGSSRVENGRYSGTSFSYPAFEKMRNQNTVFSSMFGFANYGRASITADGEPSLAQAQMVSGGAFEVLGARPSLGRTISASDDLAGAAPVAMLGHGYWQRQFGGDPAIVGRSISVNGKPVAVIGVAAANFIGITPGSSDEMWMPLSQMTLIAPERVGNGEAYKQNDFWWVLMMARLKPGIASAQAQANVDTIFKQGAMDGISPKETPTVPSVLLDPGGQGIDRLRRDLDKPLSIMMAVVFLVALIACANVANLLLARAAVRQKEIAVRLSLGTNRARLVRQLLTESALLAGLGTAFGCVLAFFGSKLLLSMMGRTGAVDLSPDLRVLGFTTVAAIVTTLLFGLAPALRATSIEPFATLRENTAGALGGRTLRLARVLVVGQVALSLVLLAGASLFARTLHNLRQVDPGFNASGILLFGVNAAQAGLKGPELMDLYERIRTRIESTPGVKSATMTPYPLLSSSSSSYSVTVPGYTPQPKERMNPRVLQVGQRFFETMELPLKLGRPLDARDVDTAPKVAIANLAFAQKYLGDAPVGRTISFSPETPGVEIVGVAANAKYDRLRGDIQPTLYLPMAQSLRSLGTTHFEVRTTGEPLSLVPEMRKAVAAIHPGLPLFNVKSQADQIDELLLSERLFATLTTFFGGLALALVCVGLYGIISYGVTMRTTEIGVRMAIGARSNDILSMVLRETGGLVSKGVLLGAPIALAAGSFASKFIEGLLYGVESTDAASLVAATVVMALIGSLAGVLPARRAAVIAPMSALRAE
ncbi:MAG: ABC transporter permease, partial [Vicinamibacteria bacterium]